MQKEGLMYISVDPGEVCGFSVWKNCELIEQGEKPGQEFLVWLEGLKGIDMILYEGYALRGSASKAMINNEFYTIQVIGVVRWLAWKKGWKVVKQMPAMKEFFDNDRLKELGVYSRGFRHSRDSVRHALYWQFFTTKWRKFE